MDIRCPSCGRSIPLEDINVSTDIALCRACSNSFRFSDLMSGGSRPAPSLSSPPSGAWFDQTPGGFSTGATTRSWMAAFLLPFTCVWAGGSLSGIYGTQFVTGKFSLATSLFGIPFLLGSVALISMCAMMTAGKISVTKTGDQLLIFTGVGPLGWTRCYSWTDFYTVSDDMNPANFRTNWPGAGRTLALAGKRKVTFGSMWNTDRRYFVMTALREMLKTSSSTRIPAIPTPRF